MGNKRTPDPLEPEVQMAVSFFVLLLETELGSPGKAASALNWCSISPAICQGLGLLPGPGNVGSPRHFVLFLIVLSVC